MITYHLHYMKYHCEIYYVLVILQNTVSSTNTRRYLLSSLIEQPVFSTFKFAILWTLL